MRKNVMKLMMVIPMVLMLTACGNNNSKVDQVVQDQMQEADDKAKQDGDAGVTEEANDTVTTQTEVNEESAVYIGEPDASVDVDLTALSSTMIYSEVYNMLTTPDDYIGKIVKMNGMFVVYSNEDQSKYYPAVIIADATACCSQGLEFILEGNPAYPDGYPEIETEITVIGTFETYEEDGNTYCRLQNSKMEKVM